MEPTITPSSPGSRHVPILLAAGGIVLALVLLFLGRQLLQTDIVSVTNSPITFSTDRLLYRTASGSTVPVTITASGVTPGAPLVAIRMTLDGLPPHVSIDEKAITGTGSTVIGKANVQRYGEKAILLLSDIEVDQDGPFLTIPLTVTADPNDDVTSVVRIWSDPTPGSAFVSQIAINDGGNYLSRRMETGPFFRLSQLQPTPACTPRPACLGANPPCQIPEPADGWCPTPTPFPGCIPGTVYCNGACIPDTDLCVSPSPTPITVPTPTPTATPTPICLPNGLFCGTGGTGDLPCCSGQCTASGSTMVCVSSTPTPTPTATPTAYCAANGEFCTVHIPCCSGQCGSGTGTTLQMICVPTPSPTPTATPTPSPSPTTAPVQCSLPLRGDVNCDGRITIVDLVLLVDFLAGKASLSESQIRNANVAETDQGRTNLADVAAFADFLSGRSPTL